MSERPDAFRKRGGQGMQDSGVGSFGSESDSSPVQQSGSTVSSTGAGGGGQSGHISTATTAASGPCHPHNDRGYKPTISVIPQSPPIESVGRKECFSFEDQTTPPSVKQQQNRCNMDPNGNNPEGKVYYVTYCGESTLDRRYTRPMLPWIMAEIRRNPEKYKIKLQILMSDHILRATTCDTNKVLFQHRLQTVSSFARAHHDPKCFVYLTRLNVDSPFTCQVFESSDETKVPELFTAIREATKEAVRESHQHVHTPEGPGEPTHVAASHLCEVMYVGKVVVTSKKAPPTFIDEAVEKFKEHERQKSEVVFDERRRHSSGASVQSLPTDLEQVVSVRENELESQTPKSKGSSDSFINLSEEDVDAADNIPLGGSSSSFILQQALQQAKRKMSLESSFPSDLNLVSNSQDSIKNILAYLGQADGQGHGQGHDSDNLQKMVLQSQAQVKKNRTMLIQVGQNDICLISTDRKKVIFERKFTDISFCSQGIQHPEHFGFISRDLVNNNFMCYVFRCATEALVEEVMQMLKQAFHAAYQQNAKNHVVCELCPMHQLHKLCQEVDKQSIERVHEILIRRIELLGEKDRQDVMDEYRASKGVTIQEKNDCLMSILRHMSEEKQKDHIHISDTNKAKYEFILVDSGPNSLHLQQGSKFDQLKSKAKKSLTTSFENILHRMPRKEEMKDHFRQRSLTVDSDSSCLSQHSLDSSMAMTPDSTPLTSPQLKEFHEQFPTPFLDQGQMPRRRRSRSTTAPPTQGLLSMEERVRLIDKESVKEDIIRLFGDTSPLKSMFNRVASSMNTSAISNPSPSPNKHASMISGHASMISGHALTPFGKGSWRMDILNRVVTPVAKSPKHKAVRDRHKSSEERESSEAARLRKQRWRHLWRKAILETLLLIRMEKENSSLQARQDEVEIRRLKLDYEEITPCLKEVTKVWDRMLSSPIKGLIKFDYTELSNAVKDGVPRAKRGDIWQLLFHQHELHNHQLSITEHKLDTPYEELLKQLTTHQHAILIDLGRTFPGHPYFTTQLGPGQLALFNLLKAYSLLDKEVGYCQGLSFVAGILLMHMPEEMAFHTMKYMMSQMGFRRQYRPDMVALQIQLYQLSRLLHDYHRDLYEHLEKHEIAPTLYAAPWFLTLFASQFPLGFVARVFDLIFLQGMEVVFKVALVLLGNHKELIKQCNSFETIMEFLKTTLPSMGIIQMERVINQVFQLDLSKELDAYEVEYHVLQEEMLTTPQRGDNDVVSRLEQANHNLKRQNLELLEQLQTSRGQCSNMEMQMHNVQGNQNKLKSHIRTLELERAALLNAVAKLRKLVPDDVLEDANISIPPMNADKTITNSPIHNPLVNRFLEDLDVKFTSSSLTEVDKEVAALMAAKHRKLSDQGQSNGPVPGRTPPQSRSNEHLLTVQAAHDRGRPASSNY